jgi:hypothetical protein
MQFDGSTIRVSVLLSLQRALLGEVFPALRGLSVKWNHQTIHLFAYIDGPIASADKESIQEIETEVLADFPESSTVETEIIRQDSSIPLPKAADVVWVYYRREP